MASPEDIAELQGKLDALVARRFGVGGWAAAFAAYDRNRDGQIGAGELEQILGDADVGSFLSRSAWVDGVLVELDRDRSGGIAYHELERVISQRRAPDPSGLGRVTGRPDYLFPLNYTPAAPTPPPARRAPAPAPSTPAGDSLSLWLVAAAALLFLRRR